VQVERGLLWVVIVLLLVLVTIALLAMIGDEPLNVVPIDD
jgi:hypothetical protein